MPTHTQLYIPKHLNQIQWKRHLKAKYNRSLLVSSQKILNQGKLSTLDEIKDSKYGLKQEAEKRTSKKGKTLKKIFLTS